MARAYWDAFNARVMLNVPIRGIRPTPERIAAAKALKGVLKFPYGIDEQVMDYLFSIWGNKKYQKELDDFVKFFISSGRRLAVYISENDPIVPVESAYLEGVTRVLKSKTTLPPIWLALLMNPGQFTEYLIKVLVVHGEPLKRADVIDEIRGLFGKNLAAAA